MPQRPTIRSWSVGPPSIAAGAAGPNVGGAGSAIGSPGGGGGGAGGGGCAWAPAAEDIRKAAAATMKLGPCTRMVTSWAEWSAPDVNLSAMHLSGESAATVPGRRPRTRRGARADRRESPNFDLADLFSTDGAPAARTDGGHLDHRRGDPLGQGAGRERPPPRARAARAGGQRAPDRGH